MKIRVLFILTLLTSFFCHGQKLNKLYYGVPSDSLYSGHQLMFTTDTTLEISTFPRHMSKQFKITLKYTATGNEIKISNSNLQSTDSIALINHGFTQFIDRIMFTRDNKALVDTSSRIIYVLYEDFDKRYYLTYIIDGETYKQETGLSDAYGLIKNNPKENSALKDRLASLNDKLNNYTVNVYKGLEAYRKFGYESVFGVIVLRQKE